MITIFETEVFSDLKILKDLSTGQPADRLAARPELPTYLGAGGTGALGHWARPSLRGGAEQRRLTFDIFVEEKTLGTHSEKVKPPIGSK